MDTEIQLDACLVWW